MTLYHILGWVSSLLFLLTWFGLFKQVRMIEKRRLLAVSSTTNLSLNQFSSSFFAFYSNFIFGISIEVFNHYLVWTRVGALILTLFILYRIYQDRHSTVTKVAFYFALFALIVGGVSIMFRPYPDIAKLGATTMMIAITLLLIQGTLHQIWTVYRTKQIGALSVTLFRSILVKDISTLMFALTMPLATAWPLLVLNGASTVTRGALLMQLEWLRRKPQRAAIATKNQ